MKIMQILGLTIEEKALDALELALIERFNRLSQEQAKEARQQGNSERFDVVEKLVMEHYSQDKKECERFLDELADRESEENEDFYLYGIRDGLRAAKWFMAI